MKLGNKSTKRRNNEATFKNQSTFFKPRKFKSLKIHLSLNAKIHEVIRKLLKSLVIISILCIFNFSCCLHGLSLKIYTEKYTEKSDWATFENQWHLLLRELLKEETKKQRNTNINHAQNFYENAYYPAKKTLFTK